MMDNIIIQNEKDVQKTIARCQLIIRAFYEVILEEQKSLQNLRYKIMEADQHLMQCRTGTLTAMEQTRRMAQENERAQQAIEQLRERLRKQDAYAAVLTRCKQDFAALELDYRQIAGSATQIADEARLLCGKYQVLLDKIQASR